jgi:hypothetical protein
VTIFSDKIDQGIKFSSDFIKVLAAVAGIGLVLMLPYITILAGVLIGIFEKAIGWGYDGGEYDLGELITALENLLNKEDE